MASEAAPVAASEWEGGELLFAGVTDWARAGGRAGGKKQKKTPAEIQVRRGTPSYGVGVVSSLRSVHGPPLHRFPTPPARSRDPAQEDEERALHYPNQYGPVRLKALQVRHHARRAARHRLAARSHMAPLCNCSMPRRAGGEGEVDSGRPGGVSQRHRRLGGPVLDVGPKRGQLQSPVARRMPRSLPTGLKTASGLHNKADICPLVI